MTVISRHLCSALALAGALAAQEPAPPPQPASTPGAAAEAPAPAPPLKAQYKWGYAGADGQGKGILNVLLDPGSGRTIVELQGLGERLVLLEGDSATGYRLQIPRRKVDERAASFAAMALPFLPQVGTPSAMYQLLVSGDFKGVKVTSRDAKGPVKMRYQGKDDRDKEVMVWLERTRWELGTP